MKAIPELSAEDIGLVENNMRDSVTVDIPLLIRLMEYAREDAPDDEALHLVAERCFAARGPLSMANYNDLVGRRQQPQPPVKRQLG